MLPRRVWLIYFVPFIGFIIWQVIVLMSSGATDAQWVVSAEGQEFSRCSDAINIDGFDMDADIRISEASVSPPGSYDAAREVISEEPAFHYGDVAEITLPDDERRVVWAHVFVTDDGGDSRQGSASIVYMDGDTNEPLVLVTDVVITEPFAAGCQLVSITTDVDEFFDKWQPLIYLFAYALAMAGAIGFTTLLNRFRARRARKSEG